MRKREREKKKKGESFLSSDITADPSEGECAVVDVGWLKR